MLAMLFVADKLLIFALAPPPITNRRVFEIDWTVREICWSMMSFALSTTSSNFSSAVRKYIRQAKREKRRKENKRKMKKERSKNGADIKNEVDMSKEQKYLSIDH